MLPAHFIWDLKCFLMAELKQPSRPALDAPCLSPSQIYSTRTMSAKQVWLMNVSPILNFYPNTLKSTYIIVYAFKKKKLFALQFLFVCSFIACFSLISGYMHHHLAIRGVSPPPRHTDGWFPGEGAHGASLSLWVCCLLSHTLSPHHTFLVMLLSLAN